MDDFLPATFDIETTDWVNPIAVGFFDGENYFEFIKQSLEDDVIWRFLDFLKSYPLIKVLAHNATDFDNKFILNTLQKRNQTVRFIAGMGKLEWVETGIQFEDSYLLLTKSLKVLCRIFDVESKKQWDHDTTLYPWEMEVKLPEFKEYLKRDCLALAEVVSKFSTRIKTLFNVEPALTLSLTAVKVFDKNFYSVHKIHSNETFERYIRAATYGGRNETYIRFGSNINLYDTRSMFTSCYNRPVPVGRLEWCKANIDDGTLAEAKVQVPRDYLVGPLPYRYRDRLIFPVGEFTGWWDMAELQEAAYKYNVDITILRQLKGEEIPVLDGYGLAINKIRLEEPDNPIWKNFGLRLSGKFGQSRWRTEISHCDLIEDFTGWTPMDRGEIYHEKRVYIRGHKAPYTKPAISMRIRSEARVKHLAYIETALKTGSVFYGDTDSVYTTAQMDIGPNAGDLQLVDEAMRAYFIRGKLYGYINKKGTLIQRSSGFRDFKLTEYDFKRLLDGGSIIQNFKSPGSWKSAFDENIALVEGYRDAKMITSFDNRINEGIYTRPHRMDGETLVE